MKEKLFNYDSLPLGSVWDGSPIRRTLNCDGCLYMVNVQKDADALEICAWGVAWKVLEATAKPGKCLKIDKAPPEWSSLKVIQRICERGD